jgi:hypothetical protein
MSTEPSSPPNTIAPQLPERANVLLLTSTLSSADNEACIDLLTVTEPERENVLSITFTQSADDRLSLWQSYVDDLPAQAGIVTVDVMTRSAASDTVSPSQPIPTPIAVESVSDPSDLTGFAIEISKFLSTWEGVPNQTVVCFHSLTQLLQYADLQRVFRFLHVLTGRLESAGAVAHFHLDPQTHDEQTLGALSQLFDVIVEHEDGEYTIRT